MLETIRTGFQGVSKLGADAAFFARVARSARLLRAPRPAALVRFAREAIHSKRGPHLAIMWHAHTQPDAPALIDHRRQLDHAGLDAEINRVAHALARLGVTPGDRVALLLPNRSEYLVIQQALARLGGSAVQIGYRLKPREVAFILEDAEPTALFVDRACAGVAAEALRETGALSDDRVVVVDGGAGEPAPLGVGFDEVTAGQPGDRPPAGGDSDRGGMIVYTSGTTGRPKGASRNWRQTGVEAFADLIGQVGMTRDERHLVVCPLYHSGAAAFANVVVTLGGALVLRDHFDAEAFLEVVDRERITSAFLVPTMMVRLLSLPDETRARYDTSSLRWICSGAAPLATDTARRFQRAFGPILWNFYGATETGVVTLAGPRDHETHPGTVGRLLRGNELRVLGEDGGEAPVGEVGELYVRNDMLIAGYHRNDDATRESMNGGYFSVGDLARVDADGYVYLASRKHDMVISGGVNVYPREIEDHLHEHPDVVEAAVLGVPDPEWGEVLKAFVVVRPGADTTGEAIVAFCREGLADFKRPRLVEFVAELPRSPTGKVLKRLLADR